MICFYHKGDLDGHCSGAIVRSLICGECRMIGVDYEEKFPMDEIRRGETVIMCDFSLKPEGMFHILNTAGEFVWIDHHRPIIEELRGKGFHNMVRGSQEVGVAACEQTWKFLSPAPVPRAIQLLGAYDVFNLDADVDILPFQYGVRAMVTDPALEESMPIWETLFAARDDSAFLNRFVRDGKVILRYLNQDYQKFAAKWAGEGNFHGHPCIFMNHPSGGSKVFESIPGHRDKLLVSFGLLPDGRKIVHLYSFNPEIDCGEIAKGFGGGGHKGAAGFVEAAPQAATKRDVRSVTVVKFGLGK